MERIRIKLSTALILGIIGSLIGIVNSAPIFEVSAPLVKGTESNHIPRIKESPLPIVPRYAPGWSKRVSGTPVVKPHVQRQYWNQTYLFFRSFGLQGPHVFIVGCY